MAEIKYETIIKMELGELIGQLHLYELEDYEVKEILEKVRFGIALKFDSLNVVNRNTNINFVNESIGKVIINGHSIRISDFYTEIENRKALARKTIISINEKESRITPTA